MAEGDRQDACALEPRHAGVAYRGRPLTSKAIAANARPAPQRVAIESLFGLMTRYYGDARVRDRCLARNATQLQLLCMAINLRRAMILST